MKPIIEVQNLCKTYQLGFVNSSTLKDSLHDWWDKMNGRSQHTPKPTHYALDNISFKVYPGEVLGLIGRNGSGKSTTLKILSKITSPTSGRAVIRGRFSSLLEVGTGFHRDLSGRENIYMNGAILGMSKREIDRKLDEIINFSEIEKFIDTPVKKYSSGMYVRLAFAVAANLDQQVLMIDEVLAVGDSAFQEKCLRKTLNIAGNGRTILFVSHDVNAIRQLCQRCVYLKDGKVAMDGKTEDVLEVYQRDGDVKPVSPILIPDLVTAA